MTNILLRFLDAMLNIFQSNGDPYYFQDLVCILNSVIYKMVVWVFNFAFSVGKELLFWYLFLYILILKTNEKEY